MYEVSLEGSCHMMSIKSCFLLTAVLALLLAPPVHAAPPAARLTVNASGNLNVPAATLKKLRVKPADRGLVCVQFPLPPTRKEPKPPKGAHHHQHQPKDP